MKRGTITTTVMGAILAVAMTACNKVPMSGEVAEDGTRTYTLSDCKTEDMSSVNFTVEEDQSEFVIESDLSQGTAHVSLKGMADIDALIEEGKEAQDDGETLAEGITSTETVLSYDATGTDSKSMPVEPGDYMLTVTGDDASPSTGTLVVSAR